VHESSGIEVNEYRGEHTGENMKYRVKRQSVNSHPGFAHRCGEEGWRNVSEKILHRVFTQVHRLLIYSHTGYAHDIFSRVIRILYYVCPRDLIILEEI